MMKYALGLTPSVSCLKDFTRARLIALAVLATIAATSPAIARLWKPTPLLLAQDYTLINHNKGDEGRVVIQWMASPTVAAPTLQQTLDKYVVIGISHTRGGVGGVTTWDDIEGVQVTDTAGQPLKEVASDAVPPALVGFFGAMEATMNRASQGKAKMRWYVFEPAQVAACAAGKLSVTYDGETYTYDTPIPGCAKP
jgi:hypothetical protein